MNAWASPPAVVLVRPIYPGNLGSTARAMANTGLRRLLLVEPAAAIDNEARALAVGAADILESAEYATTLADAVAPFEVVVGTSSARDRALERTLRSPRELASELAGQPDRSTALVFGSEVSGLNNEELALCSHLVSIPAARRQPTYNLSQAVLILAYELMVVRAVPEAATESPAPAPAGEIDGLFTHLATTLGHVGFSRDDTFDTVLRDLRALAARSLPTAREVRILRGILRRIDNTVGRRAASTVERQ